MATDGRAEARTDIAALSAGVVAVAVSMFVVPGPFDVIGVMIAITLALLIVGYVWDHPRDRRQSLAVAALLGIMAIPVVSFAVELALAPDRMLLLETGKLAACEDCEQELYGQPLLVDRDLARGRRGGVPRGPPQPAMTDGLEARRRPGRRAFAGLDQASGAEPCYLERHSQRQLAAVLPRQGIGASAGGLPRSGRQRRFGGTSPQPRP